MQRYRYLSTVAASMPTRRISKWWRSLGRQPQENIRLSDGNYFVPLHWRLRVLGPRAYELSVHGALGGDGAGVVEESVLPHTPRNRQGIVQTATE